MIENAELKAFFEFLTSNQASNSYTDELKVYVADAKQSTENKMQFMTWERQRADDFDAGKEAGIAIGIEQGVQQKAVEAATNMLKDDDSPEKVARCAGLPLEQVIALKEQLSAHPSHVKSSPGLA